MPRTDWTDRFLAKVAKGDGCWTWKASVRANGYGQVRVGARVRSAHRVAYELAYGQIPPGLVIDHLCRNRRCVRPSHLDAVTQRTNVLRGVSLAAHRAAQTHCIHGHLFDAVNTYVASNGTRKCRACRAARSHARRRQREVSCVPA
ncbi:HNH endonuclease signature motif containing protein [Streptomyces sp. NPDC001262]|uniref:HNH endonuclease signature motif containing protein n=1 Tax=Streptomyces sp. NPDC001262 TaxID=3364552 RepID=UPI0036B47381